MPYLLMNGNTTENLNTYLRDVLFLNFKTLPSEIPFNEELGLNRYVLEESLLSYVDKVRESVNDFLARLNRRHNSRLTVKDVSVRNNSTLVISINLEDVGIEDYLVPILEV